MSVTASFDPEFSMDGLAQHLPVCTEALFREIFFPIADKLNLDLVRSWGTMAEVTKSDFPAFVDQLIQLRRVIDSDDNLTQALKDHVRSRLDTLNEKMLYYFATEPDGTVSIG